MFLCEGRRIPKSQVIIKRPTISHKNHSLRAHISDDLTENERPEVASSSRDESVSGSADVSPVKIRPSPSEEPQDELYRIRNLLRPPPIPDVPDWGIPAESSEPCDPVLRVRRVFILTLLPPHSSACRRQNWPNSLLSNTTL